jgi:hypothetical protein
VKAFGQVRVGQEGHAEGDGIGFAGRQHLGGAGLGEFFVGDVAAAESGLELRTDAPFAKRFPDAFATVWTPRRL